MGKAPRRRRGGFLDELRLDDAYLRRPDRKTGQPGLFTGFDPDGDPVLVKVWQRQSAAQDDDLQEIWHNEVRQLHRLGGYPGAAESIAPLHQAGLDDVGFYLVLKPGQRRPLATILQHAKGGHWLINPRSPANRARLWRNMLQVVSGLETLHAQGLLHRNLDRWAILATGGEDLDFQLTGFEWSLRLVSAATGKRSPRKSEVESAEPASFLQDWKALGLLTAELMGIGLRRLQDQAMPASRVSDYTSVDEVRLLRNLVQAESLDRLDGEVVTARINGVLLALEAEIAGRDPKLHLVVRLGIGSTLSERIRVDLDGDVEISAVTEQVAAINDDLSSSPLLLAVRSTNGEAYRLLLQGRKLLYRLSAYVSPRDAAAVPTWELAYSDRIEPNSPATINLLGKIQLQSNSIEVMTAQEATSRFSRLRGKLTSWEALRSRFEAETATPTREERLHQALALTQFLEALFAAADAYPVEMLGPTGEVLEDGSLLSIKVRNDPERDTLSKALGISPPALRFDETLRDDRRSDEWVLTEARHVGERQATDTTWRFIGKRDVKGGPAAYSFSGPTPPTALSNPVLIPGDFVGRDIQFRRRLKALRALADHAELLKMLVDPRLRILDSHDKVEKDEAFEELDESKQQALASIVNTLPLFLVQGPPGVGKTRLVRDIVRDTFREDATARLLLTAQSNAAVDHLLEELHGAIDTTNSDVLIVRCRARDSNEEAGPYEVSRQSQRVLSRLAASELVAQAPDHLRQTVHRLAQASGSQQERRGAKSAPRYARQAFEGLMVRAANVVFATTNSFELERLIDERGQFDWAMIEEAGKATGGELLSPLLLSHRRLMIGDHKQLSPFNSERIIRLLENPEAVREALRAGQEFIGRTLRDPSTDEILDEVEETSPDFPALCTTAIECLILFERLIETEFATQKRRPGIRPIAHRLTQQHRMHPAIARVVSKAFYAGDLKSHPRTETRYAAETCPVSSSDQNRLPEAPIVVIDMPYIQKTVGVKAVERGPRWHNPEELGAVVEVVRLLRPSVSVAKPPSLAILSPYSEQVKRLKQHVDENVSAYSHLAGFRPAVGPSEYCGTVDSFQGNEADVVVVSLVRNNHHSGVRSALGFLSDARRMNVLLSRARWRMILVGSLDFLRGILKSAGKTDAGVEIEFLADLLKALQTEEDRNTARILPVASLLAESHQ